ncbi:hypothetical protein KAK07_13330 [Ideonella sp. 4Y16]|uniref:hypothetical protein n=1 Tax=Ideonella alba TaxID=2824118 RepID=UPI001B36ED00|nr:hypothetical protein [Ideonella alba]MBQ0944319.1 hypothetical protein [Ideonella alba]
MSNQQLPACKLRNAPSVSHTAATNQGTYRMTNLSKDALKGFNDAAQSLRLYRRADLTDPDKGNSLIEALYVDPLPEQQIFVTMLRPNTTFLIGRKGTGKSTIFQRLQYELRKVKHQTSAYIDIKTLYESSQVDAALTERAQAAVGAMPREYIHRVLLHREFLRQFVLAIKDELSKRVKSTMWSRVREKVTRSHSELFEALDELLDDASEGRFISVLGIKNLKQKTSSTSAQKKEMIDGLDVAASASPELRAKATNNQSQSTNITNETEFGDVLMHSLDVNELISRLKSLLERLGIRNLYLLIDDFSELPFDAMKTVVDVLLAPLNNWSDEFVKLKIAAYPGRVYYGEIDKTKIDEIHLDLYRLYGLADVTKMEESAIDFTERLVRGRLSHFARGTLPEEYFDGELQEIWRTLFFATMGNPRNLGYLMHFLYESHLIYKQRLSRRAISEAARKYYEEKVESYFYIGKFLHESFNERSSIYSLKELLESIVKRARELRSHDSSVIRQIKGRPPTSHFHVPVTQEALLSSLELNFFLTKYFEMSDRDGRKVAVFALNFGLCDKYTISFGRPAGEREFRLYFVERIFDFTALLVAYLAKNQEIQCESCRTKFPIEQLEALRLYGMRCPKCGQGVCTVTNLSKKYAGTIAAVDEALLLPRMELGILQTLAQEGEPMRAGAIASELDCSYQMIGKRGKILANRGLLARDENDDGIRVFSISEEAKSVYFSAGDDSELDVGTKRS